MNQRRQRLAGWLFLLILALPSLVYAQAAAVAGIVRDASGGVLPGVTVEAASPALIEKVRSVTTDGTGQFRIIELRPGTYIITFTLAGFNTVKREGIEVTGSGTTQVNVDMRVGAIEETITVTGEAPTVDVQQVNRQRVLTNEIVSAIPSGRSISSLATLVPGVTLQAGAAGQDVGGSQGGGPQNISNHGGATNEARMMVNGNRVSSTPGDTFSLLFPNVNSAQEVTIDTGANSAEAAQGGVRVNLITKDGGNQFSGELFANLATHALASSNFTDRVKARNLGTPNSVETISDFNPGFGGPFIRDKLWFYVTGRHYFSHLNTGGMYYDLNQNRPGAWTYVPDLSRPAFSRESWVDAQGRVTLQLNARHKIGLSHDSQNLCRCPHSGVGLSTSTGAGATQVFTLKAPAASPWYRRAKLRTDTAEWTTTITSRILLQAAFVNTLQEWQNDIQDDARGKIPIMDQSTGLFYRANQGYNISPSETNWYRASLSYVTGAHALKFGFTNARTPTGTLNYDSSPVWYRVNTVNGVTTPNQITIRDTPFTTNQLLAADLGLYVQDRWTVSRLTLTGGVRYDYVKNSAPDQHYGPSTLNPARDITIAGNDPDSVLHEVSPRMGAAYDLRGNGRTALKISLNRFLGSTPTAVRNQTLVTNTTRSWNDATFAVGDPRRGNWVPDCDLRNPVANGECGAMANANFGRPNPAAVTYDERLYSGWGNRNYNWEFTTGVQHELATNVGVDVSYFRRWFGNFRVTDNLLVAATDFTPFTVTAPVDSRLPDGGRYVIDGLYDLNPNKVGQNSSFNTLSDDYGKQIQHWNGFDVNLTARLPQAFNVQGGFSTGKSLSDQCEVRRQLPELNPLNPYCRIEQPWLTQVKLLGTYTVPRVDVLVSATFQSVPGTSTGAAYTVPNAAIAPVLGRNLSGGASNVTVNLVRPETLYGERLNQLDLRFGKVLRVRRVRAVVNLDLYNALNADTILLQSEAYSTWQEAKKILLGRFAKVGLQLSF